MFVLQKQRINKIKFDSGETFEDIFYVKVFEGKTKQEVRQYIKDKYDDKGTFKMIHPGGAISDPMNIKLQINGTRPKPSGRSGERLMHRICDDYDPIVVPQTPVGRMRFIAKALRESN